MSTTSLVNVPCLAVYATLRRRLSWARGKGLPRINRGAKTFAGRVHLRHAGWGLRTDIHLLSHGFQATTRRQGGHQDAVALRLLSGPGSESVLRLALTAAATSPGFLV